ncbi:uncharacterized protein LOC142774502 isoform X2 [Rhipicephalus microplus]|uniref:uncharacterized protein LOC142774502 isoform X2 n=1 Tax=Rhipicephalus microplus TaxID=6941 RepID=UPI003F6CF454
MAASHRQEKLRLSPREALRAVSLDEPETSVGRAPDAEPVGSLFSASSDNTATSIDRDPEPVGSPFCELFCEFKGWANGSKGTACNLDDR